MKYVGGYEALLHRVLADPWLLTLDSMSSLPPHSPSHFLRGGWGGVGRTWDEMGVKGDISDSSEPSIITENHVGGQRTLLCRVLSRF